jgi:hypothetical protein|tara:strand:- start:4963 stop:7029 length:2067 start_codon:yes stop_codon:yes gene_type:complete
MAGLDFLRVIDNDTLVREEKEEVARAARERQAEPLMLGLASYLRSAFEAAKRSKDPIENIMLKALRQRNGEYEASKLKQIQLQGGSEIFMMLTEVKCRAAESWLRDILMDEGTPPWDIRPTPNPDLPDLAQEAIDEGLGAKVVGIIGEIGTVPSPAEVEQLREVVAQELRFKVLQEAHRCADKMKTRIQDQFAEGGFAESFNDFITDLVTFPVAIIKGPVVRNKRKLSWGSDETGATIAVTDNVLAPEFERVDPFMFYPEPGVSNIDEGYCFEHHPLTRMELSNLIGAEGYDDAAIRSVLDFGNSQSWISTEVSQEKDEEERKFSTELRPTQIYDALEFWGKVSGKMLLEWGLTPEEVPDSAKEYDANVWLVGDFVIKAILNYDPLGEKPYAVSSFIKNPGAFWGKGIPEIIEDVQSMANAAARSLANNMGIASGPQVEVNLERIPTNEDITQMHPWRIWQVLTDPLGSSAPAVRFNQPNDNSGPLLAVYEKFSQLADDHSGIPSYLSGDLNVKGAGRTASGLSMLMGSAGKSIRQVVMHIDADILKIIVSRQFVYNMRYDENEDIKGDAQIIPRGAINLAVKDTVNTRRVEFLQATANEFDMEIIGQDGRAAILREVAKGLQMPVDEVVPTREKAAFNKRADQAEAQAAIAPPDGGRTGGGPQAIDQAGNPAGGLNLVSNQNTGQAV